MKFKSLFAAIAAALLYQSTSALAGPNYQTGNYTLASTDNGGLVALGGAAPNNLQSTLTISPASSYPDGFEADIINQDAGRGKTIAGAIPSSFILWPGNTIKVRVLSGIIYVTPPQLQRFYTTGSTFHVNPDYGNDANDGLSGGCTSAVNCYAFQHIMTAVNLCEKYVDYGCTIQLDDSQDYNEAVDITRLAFGNTLIAILGDVANPQNIFWTAPLTASGLPQTPLRVEDGAIVSLQGVSVRPNISGSGGVPALLSRQGAILDVGYLQLDYNPGGAHLQAQEGGRINVSSPVQIINSAPSFAAAIGGASSVAIGAAVTINNSYPITFSSAFAVATDGGEITGGPNTTASSTVNGYDALVATGGRILKEGSVFPGNLGDLNPASNGGYITP